MSNQLINGIQQIGIGNTNVQECKTMYRDIFGMNALVFDESAEAPLMIDYTGGIVQSRRAALTMNMAGGGGFEIWQFTSRFSKPSPQKLVLGDLGFFAAKHKVKNVELEHQRLLSFKDIKVSSIYTSPAKKKQFWVEDKNGNLFHLFEDNVNWFNASKNNIGGVCGAVIGVSNMEASLHFYKTTFGIDEVVYDVTEAPLDIPGDYLWNQGFCRRVLLRKPVSNTGAFSRLLGDIIIELVEVKNKPTYKIFNNRFWGDCGFIHLCFDVSDMDALKAKVEGGGYKFVIDSLNSFAMEGAAGRFSYVEDPDGALIEMVETHKVPIFKKIGWYLNLNGRKNNKPLPRWMVKMMGINKVK